MLIARHEEYQAHPGELPFILFPLLERGLVSNSWEQNWHDDPEIQLCLEGKGTVMLGGQRYDFSPGDLVVANPNVLHCNLPAGRLTYACLIVKTAYCQQVGIDCRALTFTPHIQDEQVATLFRELLTEYARPDGPLHIARLHEALLRLLIAVTENYAKPLKEADGGGRRFEVVKTAIAFIREHYGEKITLDRISRAVYTDKFALCRDFKQLTGHTVMEYVADYRCQMAVTMLAEGHTVTETAHRCGFDNASYFTRTFKKRMGCLPSAWQK